MFVTDKLAYIFESNNTYIEVVSDQIKSELNLVTELTKINLASYEKNKTFTADQQNLSEDSLLKGLMLLDITTEPKILSYISTITHSSLVNMNDRNLQKNLKKLTTNSKVLFVSGEMIYTAEVVFNDTVKIALVTFFKSKALEALLNDQKTFNAFLISDKGDVLMQSKGLQPNYLKSNFTSLYDNLELIKIGTSEIKSVNDQQWLFSSIGLGISNLYLVALTDKRQAFGILYYILNRSIIVFLIVLAAVVITSQVASSYVTRQILSLYQAAKKIAAGDFDIAVDVKGTDEISLLSRAFNNMSKEIVKLLSEVRLKARLEAELATAHAVQQTLLPENQKKFEIGEISGFYESASECGGDWWHYYENDSKIWIWMADATGHGVPAALITAAIKSSVSISEFLKMDLLDAVKMANFSICQVAKTKMMMTCFVGVIDKKTKQISYVNASHEPPFIIENRANLVKKDLRFLDSSISHRLGESVGTDFTVATETLNSGDKLFVYTDGVLDIKNPEKGPLQERGLFRIIIDEHNKGSDINEFVLSIGKKFKNYQQGTELIDDVTFFAIEMS